MKSYLIWVGVGAAVGFFLHKKLQSVPLVKNAQGLGLSLAAGQTPSFAAVTLA